MSLSTADFKALINAPGEIRNQDPQLPIFSPEKLPPFNLNPKIRDKLRKPSDHFLKQTCIAYDEEHQLTLFKKKPKRKPKSERDLYVWYNVLNESSKIIPGKQAVLVDFIMFCGEMGRFMIGPMMPKHRFTESKGEVKVFSREIKSSPDAKEPHENFFHFLNQDRMEPPCQKDDTSSQPITRMSSLFQNDDTSSQPITRMNSPFQKDDIPPLLMRGVFLKFILGEQDLNFSNAKINHQKAFVVYDWDRAMFSITSGLRVNTYTKKYFTFDPLHLDPTFKCKQLAENHYEVLKQNGTYLHHSFMGSSKEKDFPNLPIVQNFMPKNWLFNETRMLEYSLHVQNDIPSRNEKYFSLISFLTMHHFYLAMQQVLITDAGYLKQAQQLFWELIAGFKFEIGFGLDGTPHNPQFEAFRKYLKGNFVEAMLVVFYEMHDGFLENPHYRLDNPEDDLKQWQLLCEHALKNLDALLGVAQIPLSNKTIDELRVATMQIRKEEGETLKKVLAFYRKQEMHVHGDRLQAKIDSSEKNCPKFNSNRKVL